MQTFILRTRILSILCVLFACVLIVKLYMIQIVNHDTYVNLADKQYTKKTNSFTNRGVIYMETKDGISVPMATVKSTYTLYINPKSFHTKIQKKEYIKTDSSIAQTVDDAGKDLENRLYAILGTSTDMIDVFSDLNQKKEDPYEEIVKDIDEKQVKEIEKLKLPFLGVIKEKKRYYPGDSLASHTIGIIGYKGNVLAGRYGLEKQFERVLKRDNTAYANFFAEIFSGVKKVLSKDQELEGDIYTTIEPTVQKELEQIIENIQKKENSDLTGAILMDPYTGEIQAMAQNPGFNLENGKKNTDISVYNNDMIQSVHEMGSIIKPLTMAVGIDVGKVRAESTYDDKGFVEVKDRTMYNFDKKGRGNITFQYALSKSLNTGFVRIAQLVGNDTLTKYFINFGLGQKTSIDLPDESAPLTDNLQKGDVEHATASFGQGIAMTPIGTIRALSVLANGGHLITPHVVKKIQYNIGTYNETEIPKLNPEKAVLKQSTIDEIQRMLVYNVDNALLDGKRKNPRYSIAAKTGTAQIASKNGGYIDGKNIHTFIGFFPAYKPRFIVFIYTIDPKISQYASESLANSFLDLTDFLIPYYGILPDR